MVRYKFFVMDMTGRIDRALEHQCRDEADAIAYAQSITDAHSVEVWHGRDHITNVAVRTDRR